MAGGFLDFSGGYRGPKASLPPIPEVSLGSRMKGGGEKTKDEKLRDRFAAASPERSRLGALWSAMTGGGQRDAAARLAAAQQEARSDLSRLEVHDRVVGQNADGSPILRAEYGPDYRREIAEAEFAGVDTAAVRDTMDKELAARSPEFHEVRGHTLDKKNPGTWKDFYQEIAPGSLPGKNGEIITPATVLQDIALREHAKAVGNPPAYPVTEGGRVDIQKIAPHPALNTGIGRPESVSAPAPAGPQPNSFTGQPVTTPEPPPPPVKTPVRFVQPVPGDVSSAFGAKRPYGAHNGVDFPVPVGTPVAAAAPGKVEAIDTAGRGDSGKWVRIRHADGSVSSYSHLSSVNVKRGDTVGAGASIALSGNTGRTTGPNLHFVIKRNGQAVDPRGLFEQKQASIPDAERFFVNPDEGEFAAPLMADDQGGGGSFSMPTPTTETIATNPRRAVVQHGEPAPGVSYDEDPVTGERKVVDSRKVPNAPDNQQEAGTRQSQLLKDFKSDPAYGTWKKTETGWKELRKLDGIPGESGPRDVLFTTTIMKMADPVGAVLEGDARRAETAAGLFQQAQQWLERLKTGGKLPEKTRKQFVHAASQLVLGRRDGYNEVVDKHRQIMKDAGFDPDLIGPSSEEANRYIENARAAANKPPVQGARRAPDGKWYVQRGKQWYRVDP